MAENKFAAVYWLSKLTDAVLVGVSGGKDSVAALDLCHRSGLKVTAYFMYFVKDLEYQQEHLDKLRSRYSLTIYEYPHPDRIRSFREGRYCLAQDLPNLTFRDVWEAARIDSGVEWLVTGEKKRDSLERRAQLVSWGAVQPARRRGFPLADWSNKDVIAYVEKHGLPLTPEYAEYGHSIDTPLRGQTLDWLYRHYRNDYYKVLADFPLADAARVRYHHTGEDDK